MLDPAANNPDQSALLAAIRNLTTGVDKLQRFLDERQRESGALSAAVERVAARSERTTGAVQALQQQGERVSADLELVGREQAAIARGLAELEDRIVALERGSAPVHPGPAATGRPQGSGDQPSDDLAAAARRHAAALGDLLRPRPPAETGPDESAPASPRQEFSAISVPSANDLYRRLDRLERKEEQLSRILELVVESAKLASRQD